MDSRFASGWAQADADNAKHFMSRSVYVITHAGYSVLWCSKLYTETALNNTEAEYAALSQEIFNVITFMAHMKEISLFFDIHLTNT